MRWVPSRPGDVDVALHPQLAQLASDGILHYQPFLPTPAVVVCMYAVQRCKLISKTGGQRLIPEVLELWLCVIYCNYVKLYYVVHSDSL